MLPKSPNLYSPDPSVFCKLDLPLVGPHGYPLVLSRAITPVLVGTVTVEMYLKWYGLCVIKQVVHDEVIIEQHPFPDDPEFCKPDESPYVDHVPNPKVVARWAAKMGFNIDVLAWEMMVGRWHDEALGEYGDEYEKTEIY